MRRQLHYVCAVCGNPIVRKEPPKSELVYCSQACHRARPRPTLEDRLWAKVDVRNPDECWEWQGAKLEAGYGVIWRDGQQVSVHRVVCELTHGPLNDSEVACHSCDNPPCCNPSHIFTGTHADNTRDMMAKGRAGFTGERHYAARVSDELVAEACNRYLRGEGSLTKIATEYGVHYTTLQGWLNGKSRRHAMPSSPGDR